MSAYGASRKKFGPSLYQVAYAQRLEHGSSHSLAIARRELDSQQYDHHHYQPMVIRYAKSTCFVNTAINPIHRHPYLNEILPRQNWFHQTKSISMTIRATRSKKPVTTRNKERQPMGTIEGKENKQKTIRKATRKRIERRKSRQIGDDVVILVRTFDVVSKISNASGSRSLSLTHTLTCISVSRTPYAHSNILLLTP